MTYVESVNYSELNQWRLECYERLGSILDLAIASSPYAAIQHLYQGGKVLDVGAGVDKVLQRILGLDDDKYHSLDSDPEGQFTFRTFREIPEGLLFDMAVMNQFLEHLTVDDAHCALRDTFRVLRENGLLVASVPNAHHPVRYHSTVTHVTNWPFSDVYCLLKHVGFEVADMLRSNKRGLPRNPIRRWLVKVVAQEFRIDWCDTIIAVARKPSG